MTNFKTPGVYIQEISTLPASVAPVATAIPAFVGYTQRQAKSGIALPLGKPVRITSLLEYMEIFGGPFTEQFAVTLSRPASGDSTTVEITTPSGLAPYLMYYQLNMYFTNGGGPCYVVPVGNYVESSPAATDIDADALTAGINALEEVDEPTILIVPEAILLDPPKRKGINDHLLAQCDKLQDRFAIIDVEAVPDNTVEEDAAAFREQVGTGNLKYGAAYYPYLKTTISRHFDEETITIADNRGGAGAGPFHALTLDTLAGGTKHAVGRITITDFNVIDGDSFTIDTDTFTEGSTADFEKGSSNEETAAALLEAINSANNPAYTVTIDGNALIIKATAEGSAGTLALGYDGGTGSAATISGTALSLTPPDRSLYNNILRELRSYTMNLYPSASMAGVYARVDRQRGVWKAPANVDVRGISEPGIQVSAEEQEGLNVHPTSGKSINVIRQFPGKGNLVWGARTLAGNDNEWRYIPVRRLYIFIEESVKKATEFVVFEPNDANTWLRVKTMIENFLSKLWRDGALAGAKPEDAFFVKVGLGQTITALDILEGRLNIEIGLAAVRPAEFIILKFSHKLQES